MQLRHWLFMLLISGVLAGCNTIEGAGEDVEAAGGAISGTAEDAEEELED